jgi:hypothetical protein
VVLAEVAETAVAADSTGAGMVFAALIDDPASASDRVDGFFGDIMLEAASAADAVNAGLSYLTRVDEAGFAADTLSIVVPITGTVTEAATAADLSSTTLATTAAVTETGTAAATPDATITPTTLSLGTWNPSDKSSNITLTNGNLTAAASTTTSSAVRCTTSATTGKYYFEVTAAGTIAASGVGIATAAANLGTIHSNPLLCAFVNIANGTVFMNSTSSVGSAWGGSLAAGDIACVAVDLVNQRIWFRKNGGNWNNNVANDPAANVGGFTISAVFGSAAAFPVVTFANTTLNQTAKLGGAFTFSVPSGFGHWP